MDRVYAMVFREIIELTDTVTGNYYLERYDSPKWSLLKFSFFIFHIFFVKPPKIKQYGSATETVSHKSAKIGSPNKNKSVLHIAPSAQFSSRENFGW